MNKPLAFLSLLAGIALVAPAELARAHDESDDVAIRIKAPLDATSCTTTPPTITVLGLVIDVTNARIEADSENEGEGEGDTDDSGTCADLIPGSAVQVSLATDVVPLEAIKVEQEGDDEDEASIQAPVQAVDATAKTITLLGLTVDASTATLEGEDDDCDEGGGQPIDLSQIVVGQTVKADLDRAQLPALVATEIELKNFTNQVEVDVQDDHGQEINDDSDDVTVDVTQTVIVKQPRPGKPPKSVKKNIHFQLKTHGSFVLSGLPKGNATIKIVRDNSGTQTAARRVVRVLPNKARTMKVRLHKTHAH